MSRLASLMFAGAATIALIGCATEESTDRAALGGNPNNLNMEGCVKIEGAQLGQAGLVVTLDGVSVTFESWISKDGELGEYVGFTLSTGATFYIKAGNNADNLFEGTGTSWVNPNGTSGSAAKGISNIQICDIDEPPPPPPGDNECGGSEENPCPPPPPPDDHECGTCPPPEEPPPPPPEECGSVEHPCEEPPPPPPEECGSETNPCPPPPECGSDENPCPVPPTEEEPPCDPV